MNFVPYAVPFFLLLILVELAWGWLKGNNTYRINDSLNSLSLGLLSTVTKFVFLNIGLLVFSNIGQNHAIWSFNIMSTSHWLLGIFSITGTTESVTSANFFGVLTWSTIRVKTIT